MKRVGVHNQVQLSPLAIAHLHEIAADLRRGPVIFLADQDQGRHRHDASTADAVRIVRDRCAEFVDELALDDVELDVAESRYSAHRESEDGDTAGIDELLLLE